MLAQMLCGAVVHVWLHTHRHTFGMCIPNLAPTTTQQLCPTTQPQALYRPRWLHTQYGIPRGQQIQRYSNTTALQRQHCIVSCVCAYSGHAGLLHTQPLSPLVGRAPKCSVLLLCCTALCSTVPQPLPARLLTLPGGHTIVGSHLTQNEPPAPEAWMSHAGHTNIIGVTQTHKVGLDQWESSGRGATKVFTQPHLTVWLSQTLDEKPKTLHPGHPSVPCTLSCTLSHSQRSAITHGSVGSGSSSTPKTQEGSVDPASKPIPTDVRAGRVHKCWVGQLHCCKHC
jgi:hypothetical protein